MTFITMGRKSLHDMWLRYILLRPFPLNERGHLPRKDRLRRSGVHLNQLGERPIPPETPEEHWYEIMEERLADRARKRAGKIKAHRFDLWHWGQNIPTQ